MQTLYINVDGDTKGFVQALKKAENMSVSSGKKMAGGVNQATKAYNALKGAVVAYLGIGLVRETIRVADTYSLLESRLKLVTSGTDELARVQDNLLKVANSTRITYESTADLYTKVSRATKELDISEQRRMETTEALNKAFIVSGASQDAIRNSTLQLTQALQGGVVRAEEYNSIMENTPRVLEAVAAGMGDTGVSMGALRKMMLAGELSSEVFFKAFEKGAAGIAAEFDQMAVTVGQAKTVLTNVLFDIIDDTNDASDATDGLSSAILGLADTISDNKEEIVSVFTALVEMSELAVKGVGLLGKSIKGWAMLFDEIGIQLEVAKTGADEFGEALIRASRGQESQQELRDTLADINSEIKWLNEQMGKAGPENAEKYQREINKLRVEKIKLLNTLDDLIMKEGEAAKVAEESGKTRTNAANDAADKVKEYTEKELRAFAKSAEGITDSWQLMYRDRYEIQSRALDVEIEQEKRKNERIDAALREHYEGVRVLTQENTDYAGQAFTLLFGKIEEEGARSVGKVSDVFGDWASDLVTNKFSGIDEAWSSLWKGMLGTLVDTVAEMGANFVIDTVASSFFHSGSMKIKDDEYNAILQKGEMVIPRGEAEMIRANLGGGSKEYGYQALITSSELFRQYMGRDGEGGAGGGGTGGPSGGAAPSSTGSPSGMSEYGRLGEVVGLGVGFGVGVASGVQTPGFTTATKELGKALGRTTFEGIADTMNGRTMEGLRDAMDLGIMGQTEATSFASHAKQANPSYGTNTLSGIMDAYDAAVAQGKRGIRDIQQAVEDATGYGGGGGGEMGRGTSSPGPGVEAGTGNVADVGRGIEAGTGRSENVGGEGSGGSSGGRGGGEVEAGTGNESQGLARGGILTRPTWLTPQHYGGEAGPEAVAPLHAGPETLRKMHDDIRRMSNMKIEVWVQGNELIPTQKLDGRIKLVADEVIVDRNIAGMLPNRRAYIE